MTDKKTQQGLETPSIFRASNYHGIEYTRNSDSAFYMRTCGMQRCLPGYTYPHNAREGYHLHVVLSGRGVLRAGGQEYQVHEGQLFLLKDREEAFYQADWQAPWHYIWITYGGERAGRYMQFAGFTEGVYVQDCSIAPTAFFDVVKEILERQHLTVSSELYRMSLAIRFLSLAVENHERVSADRVNGGMTADDYVSFAARFMESNYSAIRIKDVADYIGINRTYLTAIFRKKMLMSPQEYLMQVRMNKSRELLCTTTVPIHMVAREVGYEDQLAFSRIFRKKFGMSPGQYRKKHQDEH